MDSVATIYADKVDYAERLLRGSELHDNVRSIFSGSDIINELLIDGVDLNDMDQKTILRKWDVICKGEVSTVPLHVVGVNNHSVVQMIVCTRCKETYPESQFIKQKGRNGYNYNSWCRLCANEHRRNRYNSDPEYREFCKEKVKIYSARRRENDECRKRENLKQKEKYANNKKYREAVLKSAKKRYWENKDDPEFQKNNRYNARLGYYKKKCQEFSYRSKKGRKLIQKRNALIKEYYEEFDISQKKLAEKVGISVTSVGEILNGRQ